MAKYQIRELKVMEAGYRSLVSPRMMDQMQEQIMNIIVFQKKYRDKDRYKHPLHLCRCEYPFSHELYSICE